MKTAHEAIATMRAEIERQMITENYVSFETAKLLKEKGFDCECSCYYFFNDKEQFEESLSHWNWNNGYTFRYSAPTLQMAMKWLREVHNLIILVEVEKVKYGNVRYNWSIIDDNSDYSVSVRAKYPIYEGACEAAIKYCLENLI